MITPDEIREKARRLYPQIVTAWLTGQEQYPRSVGVNLKPSPVVSEAIAQQQALREHSKAVRGFGYTLNFQERRSRGYGQQNFADSVQFDSRDDLLRLAGKLGEFQRLARTVQLIRARQPSLESWIQKHWKRLIGLEDDVVALLDVIDYLQRHPMPGCFLRELPLAISTKLVDRHTRLLAQWLDRLLPAETIDFEYDHQHFASRYGFRSPDDQLWLRILDPALEQELRCPGPELALPRKTLISLPVREATVIIVENKINLLTLPPRPRTLALGGLGNAVSLLYRVSWINTLPIKYFGDLDVEGLEILARVRRQWPQVESCLMDLRTLEEFQALVIEGNDHPLDRVAPEELTECERAAYQRCRDQRWRLEQERLPQAAINARI